MPTTSKRLLVGLTGTNAAGKGEVARILGTRGYAYRSLSDVLREEAARRGLDPSREVLIDLGNDARNKGGPGALATFTLHAIKNGPYCIDSIRNPAEVAAFRAAGGFLLLGIDAPLPLRFARALARGRMENAATVEAFGAIEEKERSSDPNAQQIHACMKLADELIQNDGTLDDLEVKVKATLTSRGFPF